MRRTLTLGVLIVLASAPAAQQASYSYLVEPYAGRTALTVLNLPRLGTTFRLQVPTGWSEGNPCFDSEAVWLLTGSTNPALDLLRFGIRGVLFSSMEIVTPLPMTDYPPTMIVIEYAIPNDARLLGLTFYQQLLFSYFNECLQPSSHVSLSRGGCGVVGH